MRRRVAMVLLLAVCGGLAPARHDQPGKAVADGGSDKDRPADREAIHKTFQEFLKAVGKGDADAVAAFWTESGEYVGDQGPVIRGRKALAAVYKAHFAKAKPARRGKGDVPVAGKVNAKTGRAAWTIGKRTDTVYEAGVANLTLQDAPLLVHFGKERTQQWLLVRIEGPKDGE